MNSLLETVDDARDGLPNLDSLFALGPSGGHPKLLLLSC